MATQSSTFDITTAYLDIPKALAYGLVRGSGNLVFQQELASKTRVAFYLLGEGPWDSLVRLWVNRKLVTLPDTTKVHFHPGLDGEIGFGMAASSTGGDQHVDAFWTDAGAGFTKVSYGRYAYLGLKIPPDPGAPSSDMEVLADYQAMKCRIFDNTGAQTAFQWTQNPAWWICDFMLRKFVLREAKVNQPLVTAEKARFDWQSFVDAAAYFDGDIGGGIKRFSDGGLVFRDEGLTADRALEQMLLLCRSYMLPRGGKFTLIADKTRASIFTFTSDNVAPGSLQVKKSTVRSGKNRVAAKWRELATAIGGTDTTRFSLVSNTFDHAAHQRAIGARGQGLSAMPKAQTLELDYGNNTAERVARLAQYQLVRQLGDDTDAEAGYIAPFQVEWTGFEDSLAVEPGDVVTVHSSLSEEFSGKLIEVLEPEDRPNGERQYSGLEYMPNAFTDVAGAQQVIETSTPGSGLPVPAGGANFSYRPTSNPLTATDTGTDATVNIAAFTNRLYTNPQIDIQYNSGSITALVRDAAYFIDFIDENIDNLGPKTVTFRAWTTREQATGFFIGSINTPKAGAGNTTGNNDGGTGGQYTMTHGLLPVSYLAAGWTNPVNAIDADSNSYADATTTGAVLTYEGYAFPNLTGWFTSIVLRIKHMLVSLGSGSALVKYSTDDGATWTTARTISAADGAPVTTSVTLPASTNVGRVRARMELPATASSGGPNNGGTAANDASIGTTAWTGPTNAQGAQNGTNATLNSGLGLSKTSQALKVTNFGFALPSTATVQGILVEVYRNGSYDDTLGDSVFDNAVRIVKGGTIQATDRSSVAFWRKTAGWDSYGSSIDLWGTTWAYTDINATTFGSAFSAIADGTGSGGNATARIDAVRITVYYTTGGGSTSGRVYSMTQEVSL